MMKKMKRSLRRFLRKPAVTIGLLVIALALLLGSSISGRRAELVLESDNYTSQVELSSVKVDLVEKDYDEDGEPVYNVVSGGELMTHLVSNAGDSKFHVGKKYEEELKVLNSGTADEYVRVTVYRYWLNENGKKFPEMSSDWIVPYFVTGEGWTEDDDTVTGTE